MVPPRPVRVACTTAGLDIGLMSMARARQRSRGAVDADCSSGKVVALVGDGTLFEAPGACKDPIGCTPNEIRNTPRIPIASRLREPAVPCRRAGR
jgi:hypothetical protein